MTEAYNLLFSVVLAVLGVLLFLCLLRAILGPRIDLKLSGKILVTDHQRMIPGDMVCLRQILK